MGFFSSLIQLAAPIAGAVLGIPQVAGAVAPTSGLATTAIAAAQVAASQIGVPVAQTALPALTPLTAVGDRGTGALRRRTIVETFNPTTGGIFKREILPGAPAVMQSDVAAANRLNRQLRRLNKKQPKKLVKQSQIAQLKDEVIEGALRSARDHEGHHGGHAVPVICK